MIRPRHDALWPAALLVGAGLCWAASAAAETDEAAALEPIEIVGTRVPIPVDDAPFANDRVDGVDVQRARQMLSLGDALLGIPGVFVQNRYNFAQDARISIRGFGAQANFGIRGIRVIADGVPRTLPDGQTGIDAIDLGSVRSIEVIRGPFSAVHGASSGGVMTIESERGPVPPFAAARFDIGGDGFRRAQIKGGGDWGPWNGIYNLATTRLDGYRDHARYRSDQLNTLWRHTSPAGDWDLVVNAVDSPRAEDPGALTAAEVAANRRQAAPRNLRFDAGERLDQQSVGARWRSPVTATDRQWQARVFAVHRDFDNRLPFDVNSNGQGGSVALDRAFIGAGLAYGTERDDARRGHRWIVGLDVQAQRDDRRRFANDDGVRGRLTTDQDEDVSTLGLFIEDHWRWSETVSATLGLRYDRVRFEVDDRTGSGGSGEVEFTAWSPMLGVHWQATPTLGLYANAGRSFDTPTTTELANPQGATGFNQDLDEQTATHLELGARWRPDARLDVTLAVFDIDVEDALVPFELAGSGQSFFRNAGRSERRGIEASLAWTLSERWSLRAGHTWSDFEYRRFDVPGGGDLSGNALPGIPRNVSFADLTFRPGDGWWFALEANRVGSLYADDANTVAVDGYTLLGLRGQWEGTFGRWLVRPQFGIENFSDERYFDNVRINASFGRYFEPAPERNVHVGVTLRRAFGTGR